MPDPRWYQSAAHRLDAVRGGLAASAAGEDAPAADATAVDPAATSAASSGLTYEQHRQQGVRPRGQPQNPQEELAALRHGRTSPANFVLQRHAVMVCGRPVVVPIPCNAYFMATFNPRTYFLSSCLLPYIPGSVADAIVSDEPAASEPLHDMNAYCCLCVSLQRFRAGVCACLNGHEHVSVRKSNHVNGWSAVLFD